MSMYEHPKLKRMKYLRAEGLSYPRIAKEVGVCSSTVQYHLDMDQRAKQIIRSTKSNRKRNRKDYMRNYQSKRYKNDEEFRERTKKANRENQKKKYWMNNGKSNNLS